MKICCRCKRELTVDMFGKGHNCKDGFKSACKECRKIKGDKYYKENSQAVRLRTANYKKNNADKVKISTKKYKELNRSKIVASCKQYKLDMKNDPHFREMITIASGLRRSRKVNLASTLTATQWKNIKNAFDNRCCYCGGEKPLDQEHFIPLASGGEYSHNNIIPACGSCNRSKWQKDFFAWYPTFKYYSRRRESKILKYLGYTNGIQQLSLL